MVGTIQPLTLIQEHRGHMPTFQESRIQTERHGFL